ncbi:hypothetical protein BJY00DRAFT_298389 [Aspergillus carlsbadensis]|nr:hypothetical protein BJY00DRAFT_298389 [Aspergillus carlsbadensis]
MHYSNFTCFKHQHQRRKHCTSHPPPLFWDRLPKLWLTKSALREVNRRNKPPSSSQSSLSSSYTFAPDFLRNCSTTCSEEIRKLFRCGGPDLSDIRNTKLKTGRMTVYDRHFKDHINDYGVFMPSYKYPDGTKPAKPDKFSAIQKRVRAPRPSLRLSQRSLEKEYEDFMEFNDNAADEQLVIKDILPVLEGKRKACSQTGSGHPYANAKPDFYHSASLNQLKPKVQKHLKSQITPSTQGSHPVAPDSFFLKVKGTLGLSLWLRARPVVTALWAHELRMPCSDQPEKYDNHAYAITSTFQAGMLGVYATHPTRSTNNNVPDHPTDYVCSRESYQQGLTA